MYISASKLNRFVPELAVERSSPKPISRLKQNRSQSRLAAFTSRGDASKPAANHHHVYIGQFVEGAGRLRLRRAGLAPVV